MIHYHEIKVGAVDFPHAKEVFPSPQWKDKDLETFPWHEENLLLPLFFAVKTFLRETGKHFHTVIHHI